MADTRRKLTESEVAALNSEYKLLVTKLETQVVEQTVFLRKHIAKDPALSQTKRNQLDQILEQGGFKLALFRVTDANVLQKSQIQVVYEFHDDLFAYLTQAESTLPKELRGFMQGGTVLDPTNNKATAEEPAGALLTGKTKTGVPQYDAILEQRKRN